MQSKQAPAGALSCTDSPGSCLVRENSKTQSTFFTSRGHMENTFCFDCCMIVSLSLPCIYFYRNCVQQHKRHHHQSNVSTSQLQHPSERLPGIAAALRGDKGAKCVQSAGLDRGASQKGLEVTSHSEQNVTQPRQRNKSQWGQKTKSLNQDWCQQQVFILFVLYRNLIFLNDTTWYIYCLARCKRRQRYEGWNGMKKIMNF